MIQHYLQHFPSGLYGIVVYADATEEALASTWCVCCPLELLLYIKMK